MKDLQKKKSTESVLQDVLQDSKKIYDSIEIPEQLSQVVNESIRRMDEKRKAEEGSREDGQERTGRQQNIRSIDSNAKKRKAAIIKIMRRSLSTAAALLICFTIGLNSSQAFAMEMSQLPFVGPIAKVLTIRSYEEQNEETGINLTVEIPAVEVEENTAKQETGTSEETVQEVPEATLQPSLAIDVNAEIEKIVDEHLAKAQQDFLEYKEAFFATGGTEEEWAGRTMDIYVDYDIKFQNESVVSFVLYLEEAWVASYNQRYYYNLDLAANKELTLEDVLGPDYVSIANSSILAQMEQRMAENEDYVYWGSERDSDGPDMGGFTTVDENTTFYINEAGNPVVTFPEYEIAPGFMGVQEFEIVK